MGAAAKKKPDDKGAKDTREVAFERNLRVILTVDQVAERADRLAHLMKERDNKVEMAAAAAKHAKSEIAELEAASRRLSAEVRDKACYQAVPCTRVFDYRRGLVTETRTDTGEVIDERAMTEEERQMAFDGTGGSGAGDKPTGGDIDGDFDEDAEDEE